MEEKNASEKIDLLLPLIFQYLRNNWTWQLRGKFLTLHHNWEHEEGTFAFTDKKKKLASQRSHVIELKRK